MHAPLANAATRLEGVTEGEVQRTAEDDALDRKMEDNDARALAGDREKDRR